VTVNGFGRRIHRHLRKHIAAWLWVVIGVGAIIRLRTFVHGRSLLLGRISRALANRGRPT
jgi:hypothetical protein